MTWWWQLFQSSLFHWTKNKQTDYKDIVIKGRIQFFSVLIVTTNASLSHAHTCDASAFILITWSSFIISKLFKYTNWSLKWQKPTKQWHPTKCHLCFFLWSRNIRIHSHVRHAMLAINLHIIIFCNITAAP